MTERAIFAGGCFWCTEAVFKMIRGVKSVKPGYVGGDVENPTYQQVCMGNTGHAEAVEIEFDPGSVSFDRLLDVFFTTHDPTQLNRQGNDVGPQYRSGVFYLDEEQKKAVEAARGRAAGWWDGDIVTEITPAGTFWQAEDYHHDYFDNNSGQPYCQLVVAPKVIKAREKFVDLIGS